MRSVPIYVVALRRLGAKGGESLLTVSGSPTQIACSADHREAQAWAKACGGQTKRIVVEVEATGVQAAAGAEVGPAGRRGR